METGDELYGNDLKPAGVSDDDPAAEDKAESSDDSGATALVPKSLFAGREYKAGDELTFKVVHIYDDEAEVRCVHKDKDKEQGSEMAGSEAKLDAMAE